MRGKLRRLIVVSLVSVLGATTAAVATTTSATAVDYTLPSLWREYQDYFIMGTFGTWNGTQALYHYRTNSPSNALKLDGQIGNSNTNSLSYQEYKRTSDAIDADTTMTEVQKAMAKEAANQKVVLANTTGGTGSETVLRAIQAYNETNNLPPEERKVVRAHVLAWHGGQQPNYFFCNGFYYNAQNPDWASPATMLARLDNYIKQMMEKYEPYNDIIYSWDVVNEPIDDYTGQIRNADDYQVGQWGRIFRRPDLDNNPDARLYAESAWIRQAFSSARTWSNYYGADWKLYINDFQDSNKLYEPKMSQTIKMLRPIYAAGNIDGYGMQGRLAAAYPTIDMLRAQIEAGLTVADEISISESDIRSDFVPNPNYDPNEPTRRVLATDPQYPANSGSTSWIGQGNGNTFDVHNSPVMRREGWGSGANNTMANSAEVQQYQADFAADWMDLLIEYKDKVVAYQWDGSSDTNTFNRTTGGHLWTNAGTEKASFFATIGAPNRDKMRQAIAAVDLADEADYYPSTWATYLAAREAAEDLVDVRIYTMDGVQAVKDATADLNAAIEALELNQLGPLYDAWADADLSAYTTSSAAALTSALSDAAAVLASEGATESEIQGAYDALAAAVAGLVARAGDAIVGPFEALLAAGASVETNQSAYTAESYAVFAPVLAAARAVYAALADTPADDVQAAHAALQAAFGSLVIGGVDRDGLRDWIAIAEAMVRTPDLYMSAGFTNLSDKLTAAKVVERDSAATQGQVDAAEIALGQAVIAIVDKGDTAALAILDATVRALPEALYTPVSWSALASPLAASQAILALTEAPKTDVDAAYDALRSAMGALVPRPSKVSLASAISLAQTIVGGIDNYVPSTVVGLPGVLASARVVYDDQNATAAAVSAARSALVAEIAKARVRPNTGPASAAVAAARAMNTAGVDAATAEALASAIAIAEAAIANPESTQDEVDAAEAGVVNAMVAPAIGAGLAPKAAPEVVAPAAPKAGKAVLKVAKKSLRLVAGKSAKVAVQAVTAGGAKATVTWKSSNAKVAKVSKTGKITAKKAGKAIISVKANGKVAKIAIKVITKK
ncbi:MAG: endo-1,4-beta-xylanase [Bifidobacteriaceae bacterium]|jgi:hypothetical protein|nr:endo-1,4-beta-xylanase [Bifidobacteriaceae bacterium]